MSENKKIDAANAPKPVGLYPHARKVGNLLFLSGIGPRRPENDEIPGWHEALPEISLNLILKHNATRYFRM